jgi:type II secretion system protein H
MTSATKTSERARGFTLIEIVMVLAITALVSGGAITFLVFSSDERDLRKTSSEVEALARRARTTAILQQTPYALEFTPGLIRLLPFAQAGQTTKKTALGNPIGGRKVEIPTDAASDSHTPVYDSFSPSSEMTVLLRRWNSEDWQVMKEGKPQVWRFDPDGLCEPVSVRLELGDSWTQDAYHPLNAAISESQFEIK